MLETSDNKLKSLNGRYDELFFMNHFIQDYFRTGNNMKPFVLVS